MEEDADAHDSEIHYRSICHFDCRRRRTGGLRIEDAGTGVRARAGCPRACCGGARADPDTHGRCARADTGACCDTRRSDTGRRRSAGRCAWRRAGRWTRRWAR